MNVTQTPPGYNHRQFLITLKELGAKTVLRLLFDEIKIRTASQDGTASIAIDVATAMITSPTVENSPITSEWAHSAAGAVGSHHSNYRLNLRDALKIEYDYAADVMKVDSQLAESIVRLHRRVEAQLAITPELIAAQTLDVPSILPELDVPGAVAAAATQPVDLTGGMDVELDLTGSVSGMGMDLDMGSSGMDLLGGGLGGADDDVFAGLNYDDTMDFSGF